MNSYSGEDNKAESRYIGEKLFVGNDLTDSDFAEIRNILFAGCGFDLDGYKDRCIKRRIAARIRKQGFRKAADYIELLARKEQEQVQLLEALTIHVSQFFRNPTTFFALEEKHLPALLRKKRKKAEGLRIWSVGCAGGEEPYSVALLLDELNLEQEKHSIVATDVSADILLKARAAVYEGHRLVEVPDAVLAKYFQREGVRYSLSRKICEKVRFMRHNILTDRTFSRCDLILCRNMLIYFSRQEQERILRNLADSLVEGGLLVLGRAETMVSESRELFMCVDPVERIYRRRDDQAI